MGSPTASPKTELLSAAVVIDPQAKAAAAAAAAVAAGGAVDGTSGAKPDWTTNLLVGRDGAGRERWPFGKLADHLVVGLFSPAWEVRHGSALGLRDLVKVHGAAAGSVVGLSQAANAELTGGFLLSLAHSVLTLLALDRFGDFNSDQLVAPVRETAAQALAALMVHLPAAAVEKVHGVLVQMVRQDWVGGKAGGRGRGYAWEVRHAGLLGLKYEVAVRGDLVSETIAKAEMEAAGVDLHVKLERDDDGRGLQLAGDGQPRRMQKGDLLRDVVDAAVLGCVSLPPAPRCP